MRHFGKNLNQSFLQDIKSYIDTYKHIKYSDEHTACFCEAIEAIDDYYEESYSLAENDFARTNDFCSSETTCTNPFAQAGDLNNITNILKQPSFADNLFKIIDDKGLKDSKVYKRADIDRRLF